MLDFFPHDPKDPTELDFDKEIDIDVEFEYESDVDIYYGKDVWVDVDVNSYVAVDGNYAQITFDAQAVGVDGLVEADLVVLTIEDELAMVAGTIISATN